MSENELPPAPLESPIPIPDTPKVSAAQSKNTPAKAAAKDTPNSALPISDRTVSGTFPARLQRILNGPYTPNMRRSVQTCVLYEADRCLNMQYKRLKPFQRKVALHDTASDIVDTLAFIPPHYRIEIMYRTTTKRELLTPDLSWRRMKLIDRDVKANIVPKILQIIESGKTMTHDELCNLYLQEEYQKMTGRIDPYHPNWEYSHDNHFTAYRMFYLGADVNPNLPPAVDPNPNRVVPSVKPKPEEIHAENMKRNARAVEIANKAQRNPQVGGSNKKAKVAGSALPDGIIMQGSLGRKVTVTDESTERRALLKEIKDHLDILNGFIGVIPNEILIQRKRALFAMLPNPGL